jgi:hypothetical protein
MVDVRTIDAEKAWQLIGPGHIRDEAEQKLLLTAGPRASAPTSKAWYVTNGILVVVRRTTIPIDELKAALRRK